MRTISTYDFRKNMASYLDEMVSSETPFLISKFNKPVAVIKPYKREEISYLDFYGFMADAGGKDGVAIENEIRRSAKEKRYIERLRRRNG